MICRIDARPKYANMLEHLVDYGMICVCKVGLFTLKGKWFKKFISPGSYEYYLVSLSSNPSPQDKDTNHYAYHFNSPFP